MELWLLRHARARAATPEQNDIEPPLAESGRDIASQLGRWIASSRRSVPSTILESPATRTRQTAERVQARLASAEPVVQEALWQALEDDLIGLFKAHQDRESLMIIGHSPGLEWLVQWLTGERPRLAVKPGTLVVIEADMPPECGRGKIVELVQDSDLT